MTFGAQLSICGTKLALCPPAIATFGYAGGYDAGQDYNSTHFSRAGRLPVGDERMLRDEHRHGQARSACADRFWPARNAAGVRAARRWDKPARGSGDARGLLESGPSVEVQPLGQD